MSDALPIEYAKLYIADLDPAISRDDLKDAIENESLKVLTTSVFPGKNPDSLKTGTVTFRMPEDAAKALKDLNHLTLGKTEISIMYSRQIPKGQKMALPSALNIFIKDIPDDVSAASLSEAFEREFGPVESMRFPRNIENKHRNYGYCLFFDAASAAKLVAHSGKPVIVDIHNESRRETMIFEHFVAKDQRQKEWTNCYTRGFPPEWTAEDVKLWAAKAGDVQSCVLKEWQGPDGVKHSAFVNFLRHESAVDFVSWDGVIQSARPPTSAEEVDASGEKTFLPYISIHMSKHDRLKRREDLMSKKCDVYFTGFALETKPEEIEQLVRPFGKIFSFVIHREKRFPKAKGSEYPRAYIMYEEEQAAKACIDALNAACLLGGTLKVELYQKPQAPAGDVVKTQSSERIVPMGGTMSSSSGYLSGVTMPMPYPTRDRHQPQTVSQALNIPNMPDINPMIPSAMMPQPTFAVQGQYPMPGAPKPDAQGAYYGAQYPHMMYAPVMNQSANMAAPALALMKDFELAIRQILLEDKGIEYAETNLAAIVKPLADVLAGDEMRVVMGDTNKLREYIYEVLRE